MRGGRLGVKAGGCSLGDEWEEIESGESEKESSRVKPKYRFSWAREIPEAAGDS